MSRGALMAGSTATGKHLGFFTEFPPGKDVHVTMKEGFLH